MLKKYSAAFLAMVMLFSTPTAYAADSAADQLGQYKIIQSSTAGYNESAPITRAEFMVILSKLYGVANVTETVYKSNFKDVSVTDWFAPYVQFAVNAKISSGLTATTFGPNATLTYEQASVFLGEALGYDIDYSKALTQVYDLGLLKDIQVKYNTPITRGELFKMVLNTIDQPFKGDFAPLKMKLGLGTDQAYRNMAQMKIYGFTSVRSTTPSNFEVKFATDPVYLLKEEVRVSKESGGSANVLRIEKIDALTYMVVLEPQAKPSKLTFEIGEAKSVMSTDGDQGKFILASSASMNLNNNTVRLQFNKAVDTSILSNTTFFNFDNDLKVLKATFEKNSDGTFNYTRVLLNTSSQKEGQLYNLSIKGLSDQNGIAFTPRTAGADLIFGGIALDTSRPKLERVLAKTNTEIIVRFKDESSLDEKTALEVSNYSIKTSEKGTVLDIKKVEPIRDTFGILREVRITTYGQEYNTGYIVEVKNVADVFGNVISKDFDFRSGFASKARDAEKPKLTLYANTSANQIKLVFNEPILKSSALNLENYVFDTDIKVKSVSFHESDEAIVYLSTTDQPTGKSYKLDVMGVEDLFGNVIGKGDGRAYFYGNGGDLTKPKVLSIEASITGGRNIVVVSYSKEMNLAQILNKDNYDFGSLGKALYVEKINDQQVRIYTNDQVNFQKYTMTVTNVSDFTGNGLNGGSQSFDFFGYALK